MKGDGFIKIHRKMLDWGWYSDPVTKCVFLHLLLNATWTEKTYRREKLKPGDVVIGRKELAEELGLSEQQIRTALDKLEETGEITKRATNRFSVITIEKWGLYQGQDVESNQQATSRKQRFHTINTKNQPTETEKSTNKQPTERIDFSRFKQHGDVESNQQELKKQPTSNQQATNKQPHTKNLRKEEGKNISSSSIARRLTEKEKQEIGEIYVRPLSLIYEAESSAERYKTDVKNPYKYVIGFADRKEWERYDDV